MSHKTIHDSDFKIDDSDYDYRYQKHLTKHLDSYRSDFDQEVLNEIILWKVNRYANFNHELLEKLNKIDKDEVEIDISKTISILKLLLKTDGVQIAVASTILRFKNPNIYQIIDQRVYRILYNDRKLRDDFKNINIKSKDETIDEQTGLYIKYLEDLNKACHYLNIPFSDSDRILYMADKRINKKNKLDN